MSRSSHKGARAGRKRRPRAVQPPEPTNIHVGALLRRLAWPLVIVLAALGAFLLAKYQAQAGSEQVVPPARGLPHTPDYHALAIDPADPRHVFLGTHAGLYESRDGGVTWQTGGLAGKDAMNLVHASDGTFWVAGHLVLAQSSDGGRTWRDVTPRGLPHLDLHGFTADADGRLYAAAAGSGLYLSVDAGERFELVSSEVGGDVYGLGVVGDRILATDTREGIVRSGDGGRTWRTVHAGPAVGLAVNASDPRVVLAAGRRVWLSRDGGRTWAEVFDPEGAAGPVVWSRTEPDVAYFIVFERRALYRTDDGGETWSRVV